MFLILPPKDKFSPIIARNNLFTIIYIPLILYVLHLSENLYKLGKYENLKIVAVLIGLEFAKYYFYKTGKVQVDSKVKKKSFKLEKIWKSVSFAVQMEIILYAVSVLLGASFLYKFEQTFMFSSILTVLAVIPVNLYLEVDDVFQLLDLVTQPPKDALNNAIILQFALTLLGAWLGAVPIPLDWNREWQVWPTTCVLGTLSGYFIANIVSYVIQSTDLFSRNSRYQRFKTML